MYTDAWPDVTLAESVAPLAVADAIGVAGVSGGEPNPLGVTGVDCPRFGSGR